MLTWQIIGICSPCTLSCLATNSWPWQLCQLWASSCRVGHFYEPRRAKTTGQYTIWKIQMTLGAGNSPVSKTLAMSVKGPDWDPQHPPNWWARGSNVRPWLQKTRWSVPEEWRLRSTSAPTYVCSHVYMHHVCVHVHAHMHVHACAHTHSKGITLTIT